MGFCTKCGTKLVDGARFCQKCGAAVSENVQTETEQQSETVGKVYRCPNCGDTLNSFVKKCPSCGLELRGAKATSSVKEFSLKLEAIESRREYEPKKKIFELNGHDYVSKTDEQKISLIKNFSVPNTKEDMLEFMILATSNIDTEVYNSMKSHSESEKRLSNAWLAKMNQVYEKAKISYSNDKDFKQIAELYEKVNKGIEKSKRKKLYFYCGFALVYIALILFSCITIATNNISSSKEKKTEIARLENIEQEAQSLLDNGEYRKALAKAEELVYNINSSSSENTELKRQWKVKKELLIDEILDEAEKHGVHIEYTPEEETTIQETTTKAAGLSNPVSSFVEGFKQGVQPGLDSAKESINESINELKENLNQEEQTTVTEDN